MAPRDINTTVNIQHTVYSSNSKVEPVVHQIQGSTTSDSQKKITPIYPSSTLFTYIYQDIEQYWCHL